MPHFASIMSKMSSPDSAADIDPFYFHQVCGALLASNTGEAMNGETQQDAQEFLTGLFHVLKPEPHAPDIDSLFNTQFCQKKTCGRCGNEACLTEPGFELSIPQNA